MFFFNNPMESIDVLKAVNTCLILSSVAFYSFLLQVFAKASSLRAKKCLERSKLTNAGFMFSLPKPTLIIKKHKRALLVVFLVMVLMALAVLFQELEDALVYLFLVIYIFVFFAQFVLLFFALRFRKNVKKEQVEVDEQSHKKSY